MLYIYSWWESKVETVSFHMPTVSFAELRKSQEDEAFEISMSPPKETFYEGGDTNSSEKVSET